MTAFQTAFLSLLNELLLVYTKSSSTSSLSLSLPGLQAAATVQMVPRTFLENQSCELDQI